MATEEEDQKAVDRVVQEGRQINLGNRDMLVLRGSFPEGYAKAFNLGLQKFYPQWRGLLVCLKPDQDLSQIPEAALRDIYQQLKGVFEGKKPRLNSRQKRKLRNRNGQEA
jgi:hypothetical protein